MGTINQKQEIIPEATAFLVTIKGVFHLVTAKHIIFNKKTDIFIDDEKLIFFNSVDGKIGGARISDEKKKIHCDWIFHENSDVDVGIIPFSIDFSSDDLVNIPQELFLPFEQLYELHDIFFISYQPGIQIRQRISPIIRTGTISVMNDDGTFYIDAAAFPGNSGSPVFLRPSLLFDEKSVRTMGGGNFIGIIGEYLPYDDVAVSIQTGRPRVIFQETQGFLGCGQPPS